MTALRNKRKVLAMAGETQEYPRNSQSKNSYAPGITDDYIAQVSKEIGRRVTMKLSQELNRTESIILGALSKLVDFFINSQIRTFSGTVPGTIWNVDVENREPAGSRSQSDPHPEQEVFTCWASNLTESDPNDTSHKLNTNFPTYTQERFEGPLIREVFLNCLDYDQPIHLNT